MNWTKAELDRWVEASELGARRRDALDLWKRRELRSLSKGQIAALERQGNTADDWRRVRACEWFDASKIVGNRFEGEVELGRFDAPGSGIHSSTLIDCAIDDGARVERCGRVERVFIGAGARLEGIGRVAVESERTAFGNGRALFDEPLYSRRLIAVAELPFDWAARATSPEACDEGGRARAEELEAACARYAEGLASERGYIGAGAVVRQTPLIVDSWIGDGVQIDGAGPIRDSTIRATPDEPTVVRDGASLNGALIGPGCRLEGACRIERSLLFEWVEVFSHAIVKGSAVGAGARLGEAEINDSFVGPFVTALHHSLLIAAWWPEGKGNVAYGANVGSNHTGRAPDQEIFPGEGVFFGLGTSVKFPANYRGAPYSIVATGVVTLPQHVDYPFSLIAAPTRPPANLSPAINEIRPGWALLHNAYGVERQERNQTGRLKGRRATIETTILRPAIVEALEAASARLESFENPARADPSGRDAHGLGKNYMTEEARLEGIRAYAFGARVGAARTLLRELAAESPDAARLSWATRRVGPKNESEAIDEAIGAVREWTEAVASSKKRDEARGRAILDDYAERHLDVDRDPVAAAARAELESFQSRRQSLAGALGRLAGRRERGKA
jgi:hypothetical protein